MEKPYSVVLQVSPNRSTLAGRFTWPEIRLDAVPSAPVNLEIPSFVPVEGLIQCQGKLILAEAVFYPRGKSGYPIAPISSRSDIKDPAATTNFAVRLPPGLDFDVAIQPLGLDSQACPPFRATLSAGVTRFDPAAPELLPFTATLVEDPVPPGGMSPTQELQVRVWSKSLRRAVSGAVKTQLNAEFTVSTIPGELSDRVLQIDLDPAVPWQEVMEVPLASRTSAGTIRVPALPKRVTLYGKVEDGPKQPIPSTELTFRSYFPQHITSGSIANLNWCQLLKQSSDLSAVTCRAERVVQTDAEGAFRVKLLPGLYEILVAPGSEDANRKGLQVATTRFSVVIEEQAGNIDQGPYNNPDLRLGATVEGVCEDRDGTPLPNVTVESRALSESRTPNGISAFNRPASALTDDRGEFTVSLDSGFYDVVVKPPRGSGYPWQYFSDREFDSDLRNVYRTKLTLPPPLVITGQITLKGMNMPMPGATVDAYGLVEDVRGFLRPVLIGTTTADQEGKYVLALPPRLDDGDTSE